METNSNIKFEFWVVWSVDRSMTKLIKMVVVNWLWYILYPRIRLKLFKSHSHIQGFNTRNYKCGVKIVRSV